MNITKERSIHSSLSRRTVKRKRLVRIEKVKLQYVFLFLFILSSCLHFYLISNHSVITETYGDNFAAADCSRKDWIFRNSSKNQESARVNDEKKKEIQITFTHYGWHSSNGIHFPRVKATRQMYDAIVEHERYNESAFANATGEFPYYVFLDVETCGESNWPVMGGQSQPELFSDTENGRAMFEQIYWKYIRMVVHKTLSSLAMSHPDSRLIVINCKGDGPSGRNLYDSPNRDSQRFGKVVIVSLSSSRNSVYMHNDFGIPPLPIKPVHLNDSELQKLKSCTENRKYLFSFQGRERVLFPEFQQYFSSMHNGEDIYIEFTYEHHRQAKENNTYITQKSQNKFDFYSDLLKKSIFVGVPRGDNLFSYRFSEVMSAGSIPVIYADDWLMPYTRNVMNFDEFAVVIAQKNVNATKDILMKIPPAEICKMQNRALDLYNTYVRDSSCHLRGILAVLDSKIRFGQNIAPH